MTTLRIEDGRTTFKTFTAILNLVVRRILGFITYPGVVITVSAILLFIAGAISYLLNGYVAIEQVGNGSPAQVSVFGLACLCVLAGIVFSVIFEVLLNIIPVLRKSIFWHVHKTYYNRVLVILCSVTSLLLFSYFGLFTCNRSWLKAEGAALIIDARPITGTEVVRMNPFTQDISILPLDFSVKDLHCTGTTKDGMQIKGNVTVTLRRSDDPNNWADPKRMTPSLEEVIGSRFKAACAEMTASEIAVSGLSLEFQTAKDDKLAAILPPAVELDGLVKVDNIHVFIRK